MACRQCWQLLKPIPQRQEGSPPSYSHMCASKVDNETNNDTQIHATDLCRWACQHVRSWACHSMQHGVCHCQDKSQTSARMRSLTHLQHRVCGWWKCSPAHTASAPPAPHCQPSSLRAPPLQPWPLLGPVRSPLHTRQILSRSTNTCCQLHSAVAQAQSEFFSTSSASSRFSRQSKLCTALAQ